MRPPRSRCSKRGSAALLACSSLAQRAHGFVFVKQRVATSGHLPTWMLAGKRSSALHASIEIPATLPDEDEHERSPSLRARGKEVQEEIKDKARELRHDISDRVRTFQDRISSTADVINRDYVSPVRRVIENPVSIRYGVAMAARISYFLAQQTVLTTAVDRKIDIDVPALARAVAAALANGREEELLESLRIPDDRLTSGESYEWWRSNLRGVVELLQKEAKSLEDGAYKFPADLEPSQVAAMLEYNPASVLASFTAYYRDQAAKKAEQDVAAAAAAGGGAPKKSPSSFMAPGRYPEYFLEQEENFLTARAAKHMDYEMESTVWGMGDAMRRRALAQIDTFMEEGRDPETTSVLDVGCGTGRFLAAVKDNYRRMRVTALDLSLFSLERARKNLEGRPDVTYVEANAEEIPLPNGSQDLITANFLLHRMPPEAQVATINEMARCLKRGGQLIIVDATQPDFDGEEVCTMHGLPHFNKPATYEAYLHSDLEYALIKAGLFVQTKEISWVSKMIVATRPPAITPAAEGGDPFVGVGY